MAYSTKTFNSERRLKENVMQGKGYMYRQSIPGKTLCLRTWRIPLDKAKHRVGHTNKQKTREL